MILYICFQMEMIMMYRDPGIMENTKALQLWYTEQSTLLKRQSAAGLYLYNQRKLLHWIFSISIFYYIWPHIHSSPLLFRELS